MIKVSKLSWTFSLSYEILRSSLERKFDKTSFISLKSTPSKSPGLLVLIKFKGLRGLPYNEAAAGGWRNCDVRLWRQDGALCVNVRLFWVCMYIVNCILCTVLVLLNFITALRNQCILTFFVYIICTLLWFLKSESTKLLPF